MILTVSYQFDASIIQGRKRSWEPVKVDAECHVMIEEVEGTDAPVVARYKDVSNYSMGNGPETELRHWNGRLWRPAFRKTPDNSGYEVVGIDEVVSRLGRRSSLYGRPIPTLDDPNIKHVSGSTQEEMKQETEAAATGWLLVDGVPHFASSEPVLYMSFANGNRYAWPKMRYLDSHERSDAWETFRFDRFDDMLAMAEKEMDRPFTNEEREDNEKRRPDVIRPEYLNYDDERAALLSYSRLYLSAFDSTLLEEGSEELIVGYVRLRDLLRNEHSDGNAIVDTMEVMIRQAEADSFRNWSTDRAEEAIERWRQGHAHNADLDMLGGAPTP